MNKRKSNFLMIAGLLLLAAAFSLTVYNIYEGKKAQDASEYALNAIAEEINNIEQEMIPVHDRFSEKEMPSIEVDAERYIGVLEVPDIGIVLPVMGGQWSYPKLRSAPCRYTGSVYTDDLTIAAHNYNSHFGKIKNVAAGSEVRFTDCAGNVFYYQAGWIEVVDPYDVETMTTAEEWDLTLFTCTYGGGQRYALRCIKEDMENR